ncbi:MAG: reverse transcriptase domain-containing protein [Candidatus Brocadiaceae bacterium]|nr:reverse transcriptase domain-containing protein [Candidatus Brocadiaceae bacterium]
MGYPYDRGRTYIPTCLKGIYTKRQEGEKTTWHSYRQRQGHTCLSADRQQAFRQIIEPIFEREFSDNSKELEKGGYTFVRYADDFIVMTKTKEELPAALLFITDIVEGKLELELSKDKTELTNFKRGFRFLGYTFTGKYKGISNKSIEKLKDNIRNITKRTQGVNLKTVIDTLNPVISACAVHADRRGHVNYFRLGDVQKIYRNVDCWVRMRLRCFRFSRKWRTDLSACSAQAGNKRFPIRRFARMGLLSFEQYFLKKCAKV